ncbi:MAG: alpha/beta hydrolase [Pseudomonadota bacterium]
MTYHAARSEGAVGGPLFFTFHGTGGDEHQFHRLAQELRPDARVVSPRGDVSEMGALRYFRRMAEGKYDMDDLAKRRSAMADFLRSEKADTEEAIGLGYSNGANILAALALESPDIVDTLVLMHPLIPWKPMRQLGLKGRRILITAGERDPICPKPETERLVAYLKAQGADVTVHWHPGGHEIVPSEIEAIATFLDPVTA